MLDSDWTEDEVLWTHKSSTTEWNSHGGDYDNSISSTNSLELGNNVIEIDVTEHINAILDGSKENHGFILISPEETSKQFQFNLASSENSDSNLRPKLTFDFESKITLSKTAPNSGISFIQSGKSISISSSFKENSSLTLFSLNGQKIIELKSESGNFDLNTSAISSGYYFMKIESKTLKVKNRIFIQN